MLKVKFDFSKLRGKIKEKYDTIKAFSVDMQLDYTTLSKKLNNVTDFTSSEIIKACYLLQIDIEEVDQYFFISKVRKNELNILNKLEKNAT